LLTETELPLWNLLRPFLLSYAEPAVSFEALLCQTQCGCGFLVSLSV